jgi:hypothetical protein
LASVPSSLAFGEAFIGKRKPAKMIPTIVVTLMTVNQYSISPYRRTLKLLKRKQVRRIRVTQISFGVSGSQSEIMLEEATIWAGKLIACENQ